MWIPVLESRILKSEPVRVIYWGTPAVVYRDLSGKPRALEDVCPHRGMRLSLGHVSGGNIRCGYHNYEFRGDGRCASVPACMKAGEGYREACRVFSFHARESNGYVWLSAENAPDTFDPIKILGEETKHVGARFIDLRGDPRIWLDHFVDTTHVAYTHFGSVFTGRPGRPPAVEFSDARPGDSAFPIDCGSFVLEGVTHKSPLLYLGQAGSLAGFIHRLFRPAYPACEVELSPILYSPICQRVVVTYRGRFGTKTLDAVSFLNPISEDRSQLLQLVSLEPRAKWPWSLVEGWYASLIAAVPHIQDEDEPFLSTAGLVDLKSMRLAPADGALAFARALTTRYAREKGHLYPAGSLLRRLYPNAPATNAPSPLAKSRPIC